MHNALSKRRSTLDQTMHTLILAIALGAAHAVDVSKSAQDKEAAAIDALVKNQESKARNLQAISCEEVKCQGVQGFETQKITLEESLCCSKLIGNPCLNKQVTIESALKCQPRFEDCQQCNTAQECTQKLFIGNLVEDSARIPDFSDQSFDQILNLPTQPQCIFPDSPTRRRLLRFGTQKEKRVIVEAKGCCLQTNFFAYEKATWEEGPP